MTEYKNICQKTQSRDLFHLPHESVGEIPLLQGGIPLSALGFFPAQWAQARSGHEVVLSAVPRALWGRNSPPKSYLWAFPAPLRGCQCSAPALGPASQPLFFNKRGAANPSINFSLNIRMAQENTKFKYYDFCNSGLLFQSLLWLLGFTESNGSTFINIALENKSVWFNLPSHTQWKLHYTEQESSWEMLSLGGRFPWEVK